jgi:septal ring factor EnvC (AmiA/AmiB activator)
MINDLLAQEIDNLNKSITLSNKKIAESNKDMIRLKKEIKGVGAEFKSHVSMVSDISNTIDQFGNRIRVLEKKDTFKDSMH